MKKKVLVMTGLYAPGIKGGGPIQSIQNMVENLSNRIEFYIVTADRDLGDEKSYESIKTDVWLKVGKAKVYYTNPSTLTMKKTSKILNSINYDVIYLNSFFSFKFSIVPILLNKIKKSLSKKIIIAPRGQFSPGALNLKKSKKNLFINVLKIFRLLKGVTWHATAIDEKKNIERIFYPNQNILVANNLTANYKDMKHQKKIEKKQGELKIVFVSRIHPKKNLSAALEFLKEIQGKIEFNIFGPIEDKKYWSNCKKLIGELPKNITVSYNGIINRKEILDVFNSNHVFLFPTLGENYGHVISEALIGGCPVIISDQTPWNKLEEHQVGWDIDLDKRDKFIEKIQQCVYLSNSEYNEMSEKSFEFGKRLSNSENDIEANFKLFQLY